jgi:hypothetical protein
MKYESFWKHRDMDFPKSMIFSVGQLIPKNIELGNSMSLKSRFTDNYHSLFSQFLCALHKNQSSWHFSQKTNYSAKNGLPTIR